MPAGPKPVKLHREAKAELLDSVSFYRTRGGDRLADRFKADVDAALRAIADHPDRYGLARDKTTSNGISSNFSRT
jgi:plasmid stabilization system protein ParE